MATTYGPRDTTRAGVHWGTWIVHGLIGGIIGGIAMMMVEMLWSWAAGMGFFMPARMIGATLLGREAMEPTYPLMSALLTAMMVHLEFSMMFGVIFALIAAGVPALRTSATWLTIAATVFGVLLWVVNFYMIAPVLGWDWFPSLTDPVQQFVAHAMYGLPLGLYLAATARRHAATTAATA